MLVNVRSNVFFMYFSYEMVWIWIHIAAILILVCDTRWLFFVYFLYLCFLINSFTCCFSCPFIRKQTHFIVSYSDENEVVSITFNILLYYSLEYAACFHQSWTWPVKRVFRHKIHTEALIYSFHNLLQVEQSQRPKYHQKCTLMISVQLRFSYVHVSG